MATKKAAGLATLDGDEHPALKAMSADDNQYTFGRTAHHNVIIACLPAGSTGTANASNVATHMQCSFPIKFGLIVGVAGGVWSDENDGDVVVSQPKRQFGGTFERTGSLNAPPREILHSL